jgi:hypothetical protein
VPRVVENCTATPGRGLPLVSSTVADTVVVPPLEPSDEADTWMRSAAAAPTFRVISVRAPPE